MRDVGPHLGVGSKDVLIVLWGCVKSESKGERGENVADVHENAAYKNAAFLDHVTDLLQQALFSCERSFGLCLWSFRLVLGNRRVIVVVVIVMIFIIMAIFTWIVAFFMMLDVFVLCDAFKVSLELTLSLALRQRTDLHIDVTTGHFRLLVEMSHGEQIFFDLVG